jgi:hypothetical protein
MFIPVWVLVVNIFLPYFIYLYILWEKFVSKFF